MSFKEMIKKILADKNARIQIAPQNKNCQFHIGECHPYYAEVNNMDDTKITNCTPNLEIKNDHTYLRFSHQIYNTNLNIDHQIISPNSIILERNQNWKCKVIRYKGKDNVFHNKYVHQKCYQKFIIEKVSKIEKFIILYFRCKNGHEVIRRLLLTENNQYKVINIKN